MRVAVAEPDVALVAVLAPAVGLVSAELALAPAPAAV